MDPFIEKKFYTYDIPYQEHFSGYFESVFIGWFPFFKIASSSANTKGIKKSKEILLEEARSLDPIYNKIQATDSVIYFHNKDYPGNSEILAHGQEISWNEIKVKAGFNNYSEIYKALRTSIGSYSKAFAQPELEGKLEAFLENKNIWQPGEGSFDPLTLKKIYHSFKGLGKSNIIIEDEFFQTKKEINLDLITIEEFMLEIQGQYYYLYDRNKSLLFVAEWDSFFFLICSSAEIVRNIIPHSGFEGFYADSTTMHGWEHTCMY